MDASRISSVVEFVFIIAFLGIFAVNCIFTIKQLFGNSEWSVDLREGNNVALFFFSTILLTLVSLSFILYLCFTSFSSSKNESHVKLHTRKLQEEQTNQPYSQEEKFSVEVLDNKYQNSGAKLISKKGLDSQSKFSFIESSLVDPDTYVNPTNGERVVLKRRVPLKDDQSFVSSESLKSSYIAESKVHESRKSTMSVKHVTDVSGKETATGLSVKHVTDVSGKETATGLTRGNKRQLAAILDEFWGLLFDYHGMLTKEARNIRAAILLDLDFGPPTHKGSETARKVSSEKLQATQIHGTASPTSYGGFHVQTVSSYLEQSKLDTENEAVPLAFVDHSKSKYYEDDISKPIHLILGYETFWTKGYFIPSVNYTCRDKSVYSSSVTLTWGGKSICSTSGAPKKYLTYGESERLVLQSLRFCIRKLLKLDGSGWLFSQNGGADEELIDCLAMTEGLLHKNEPCEVDEDPVIILPNMSHCGKGCIWQASLVGSFGVWCVRRILELVQVECRPDLWGKYTYVLNRLQGILDPAFCKPREILSPCLCLQPSHYRRRNSGKLQITCRGFILEMIKGAEASISRRNGRECTVAGNIAYPKGKENLTSVFRRYKRRLSK